MKNGSNTANFIVILLISLLTSVSFANSNNLQNPDKTKEQVDEIISQQGSTPPDWWDSVEFVIPSNLDTSWPVQQSFFNNRGGRGGDRGFSTQGSPSNVDQYLNQVVYPNPSRHKAGIKLVNHLMILNSDNAAKLGRSLNTIGDMFYELMNDYTRAAFYWQKAEERGTTINQLKLAVCYYELGSQSTAKEILEEQTGNNSRVSTDLIKFWGKIGEVDRALEMIQARIDSGSTSSTNTSRMMFPGGSGTSNSRSENYLLAGEICRSAGRYDDALEYYQKILALPNSETQARSRHDTDGKYKANINIEAAKALKILDITRVPDGTYTGSSNAYGGTMYLKVTVNNGQIESVVVTNHRETPSYLTMAEPTARQIVTKQGFEGVDVISGATVTSEAIINAAAKALASAMK